MNQDRKGKEPTSKTCEVDGCDKTAKSRGKCQTHYDAWRHGKLPGYPTFDRIRRRKGHRPKNKKPKASPPKARVIGTLPESQLLVDLNRYPQLKDRIFATAQKFFVTPEHVLISLAGEALAAKKN